MKTCPHCDCSFADNIEKCPRCGVMYWDSDSGSLHDSSSLREEEQGCLSILVFHLLIALGLAVLFIIFGFVINLLVHFEANQIKIAWIAASLMLGGAFSILIRKLKGKKKGKSGEGETDCRS